MVQLHHQKMPPAAAVHLWSRKMKLIRKKLCSRRSCFVVAIFLSILMAHGWIEAANNNRHDSMAASENNHNRHHHTDKASHNHSDQHFHNHDVGPAPDRNSDLPHEQVHQDGSGITPKQTQITHDSTEQPATDNSKQSPNFDINDPFALTFEDYLREASKSSAHHIGDDLSEESSFPTLPPESAILETESPHPNQDYAYNRNSKHFSAEVQVPPQSQHTNHPEIIPPPVQENNTSQDLLDEIKLLFVWKQLPTTKCSKPCGKGFRVNHISCVDQKYDVRVEDDLCVKAKIPKPSETTDEPCNEIDCPPAWTSSEYLECNQATSRDGVCQPGIYKKAQCVMIDRNGQKINLDDERCDPRPDPVTGAPSLAPKFDQEESNLINNRGYISGDLSSATDIDASFDGDQQNDIPSSLDTDSSMDSLIYGSNKIHRAHTPDEPFYEAGQWSECSGAPCGQLGRRYRKLSCRLYLSRSSRFADLPESSCQNAHIPDAQEPCYMDCGPERVSPDDDNANNKSIANESDQDELVLDTLLLRHSWRQAGWTKCSADCLGGKRESIIECWDSVAELPVETSLCDELTRPKIQTETCNDVPCEPEWRTEPFSKCSRSCGSSGIKTRPVTCVQQVPQANGASVFMGVSSDLCVQANKTMPAKLEPCNRIDCKPEWSVGPWSDCSSRCGEGLRNRTVMCVQEFAHIDGPKTTHQGSAPSSDLLEAISISAKNWHPGKATQVPFHQCYDEYKSIPAIDEKCYKLCDTDPYIDADVRQNYTMSLDERLHRKTINLKIGGKARVLEGKNLKIRCKLMNRQFQDHTSQRNAAVVEWRKDGSVIFAKITDIDDKQFGSDNNVILGQDMFSDDRSYRLMADEPSKSRSTRYANSPRVKGRNLSVRSSWNENYREPDRKARISLIKESTLRIRRLRPDDSGVYTCTYGTISESLDLKVIGHRQLASENSQQGGESLI